MNGQLFKLNNARVHKGGDSSVPNLTCCFLFLNFLVFCSTRAPFGLAIQLWLELAVVFSCILVLSQPFVVLEFTGKISISILLDSELRYFSASTSPCWFGFCECTKWGKDKELPRKKLSFQSARSTSTWFWAEKRGFGCCTHLTWCLQPVGIKGVLESEFWDVVDERCVGRAFRETGQRGVEELLPPLAIVHPDAEELPPALHLVPVGAASGMAKIPLLGERKSQVEVCVCCCCTSSNLALSPGPLAGVPA